MNISYILQKAFEKRVYLFNNSDTNCFRLFNAKGDGIDNLTIDIYGEYLLIQLFNESLFDIINSIAEAVSELVKAVPVDIKGILLKSRKKLGIERDISSSIKSQVIDGVAPPDNYIISQNRILARIDLINGVNTGIFLDMREVRDKLISFYPISKNMLNFFCYTALFSIHAIKNGLKNAINVDLSKAVLNRAKENYTINNIHYSDEEFIHGDAIEWIKRFAKKGEKFSFIIFDPPTFSRNKKRSFSVKKNYKESIYHFKELLSDAYILTSINSFSVTKEEYISYHPKEWDLVLFENESSDFVHGGRPYLKVGLWKTE